MKNSLFNPILGPIHLIGISGLGMSGLAFLLREKGIPVTGSDLQSTSQAIKLLKAKGVTIYADHRASNVGKAKMVVISSAIPANNPELVAAKEQGIPVYSRGKFLAELLQGKNVLGVCGSHGKTTTAALCTYLLQKMGYAPGYLLGLHWSEQGGKTASWGGSFLWGESPFFVCETDESDGSFVLLQPTWIIVTTVEDEHLDFYGTRGELEKNFANFLKKIPFFGKSLACLDDKGVQRILPILAKENSPKARTFGVTDQADISAKEVSLGKTETTFTLMKGEEKIIPVTTNLMGLHNVQNLTAALAWIDILGMDIKKAVPHLTNIPELDRRLKKIGQYGSFDVLDDYAHHPQEIAVTLRAARQRYDMVIVCVQPHRYSRVRQFGKQFVEVLQEADHGFVFPVYAAGEPFDPLSTSEELLAKSPRSKPAVLVETVQQLGTMIDTMDLHPDNGVIIFMGAGSISDMAKQFVKSAT